MSLYHGLNVNLDMIDLAKSRPGKNFGREFRYRRNCYDC